ncbi:L,D-transpeptidase family protein [Spirillospora sp. CA-253888]
MIGIALAAVLVAAPTLPAAPAVPASVRPGDDGPRVRDLQKRLRALKYNPGPVNGHYGETTRTAVWAFQKVNGMHPNGVLNKRLWQALAKPRAPRALKPRGGRDRVEVSLGRQLLTVYRKGRIALITHISTGTGRRYCDKGRCGIARTPVGDFRVTRRVKGWRKSPLGYMYRPLYFYNGYAIHGSVNVPRRPASHGCVRVPMHTANLLPKLVRNGDRVYVRR